MWELTQLSEGVKEDVHWFAHQVVIKHIFYIHFIRHDTPLFPFIPASEPVNMFQLHIKDVSEKFCAFTRGDMDKEAVEIQTNRCRTAVLWALVYSVHSLAVMVSACSGLRICGDCRGGEFDCSKPEQ